MTRLIDRLKETGRRLPTGWLIVAVIILASGLYLAVHRVGLTAMERMIGREGQVATVDPDAINKLPEFVTADQQIQVRFRELSQALEHKRLDHKLSAGAENAERLKMQQEIDRLRVSLLKPLNDRVSRVMAEVGRRHHLDSILDKRIVLIGLPYVTDEVKDRFEKEKDASSSDSVSSSTSVKSSDIGYVDQNQIRQMEMFRKADADLADTYRSLTREFDKRQQHLSTSGKAQLGQKMEATFEQKRSEVYGALQKKVQAAISEACDTKGLSLVLDRGQVLWGGYDLTSWVVERLQGSSPPSSSSARMHPLRIGIVNLTWVMTEMPEYRNFSAQYQQEQKKLLGSNAPSPADLARLSTKRQKQIEESAQKWQQIKDRFIGDVLNKVRPSAQGVAKDKHLAMVLVDAPWYPAYPLGQYGAEDVTTDVLFGLKGK